MNAAEPILTVCRESYDRSKSLSEIRAELVEKAQHTGLDAQWLSQQIRKLERQPHPDVRTIETLSLLRDALASEQTVGQLNDPD